MGGLEVGGGHVALRGLCVCAVMHYSVEALMVSGSVIIWIHN